MASALEVLVVRRMRCLKRYNGGDEIDISLILSNKITVAVGYIWVLGLFFWITPKWQYPKMHAILTQVQGH